MSKIYYLFIYLSLISCKHESKFDLQNDVYDFSSKMENDDTLFIDIDLTVCLSDGNSERLTFIRKDDKIYLSSSIDDRDSDEKYKLKQVEYKFNKNDSLNFENLLLSAKKNSVIRDENLYFIKVSYKKQAVCYSSKGLYVKIMGGHHFGLIMRRLYPDEKRYQPIKFIEKTPG